MHAYATDSDERKIIPLFIAVISILAAWILNAVGTKYFSIPWWFDAPSVMGFYGFFYKAFDRFVWSKCFMRKIGLVKIPDLNGSWRGYVTSSFDKHEEKFDISIDIYQTWTKIVLILKTPSSESQSEAVAITIANPNLIRLSYTYFNKPKSDATQTMHPHEGTARLNLSGDCKSLDGDYYTGRGRQNYGTVHLDHV